MRFQHILGLVLLASMLPSIASAESTQQNQPAFFNTVSTSFQAGSAEMRAEQFTQEAPAAPIGYEFYKTRFESSSALNLSVKAGVTTANKRMQPAVEMNLTW